ncbi:MAG: hypothetical protein IPI67_16245 [Myxococcales bacterium]|nr:hypothetical protein [Myxococcales bacterium]
MLTLRHDPFPFEAVRDLIGILRALYAAEQRGGRGSRRVREITGIGIELRRAVDLALEHEPGTLGHAAAWDRAERATSALTALVDSTTPISPTLEAAARRVREEPARQAAREQARARRRARG